MALKYNFIRRDGDPVYVQAKGFFLPHRANSYNNSFLLGGSVLSMPNRLRYVQKWQTSQDVDVRIVSIDDTDTLWTYTPSTPNYSRVEHVDQNHHVYVTEPVSPPTIRGRAHLNQATGAVTAHTGASIESSVRSLVDIQAGTWQSVSIPDVNWLGIAGGMMTIYNVGYSFISGGLNEEHVRGNELIIGFLKGGTLTFQKFAKKYRYYNGPNDGQEHFAGPWPASWSLKVSRDRFGVHGDWQDSYSGTTRKAWRIYDQSANFVFEPSSTAHAVARLTPYANGEFALLMDTDSEMYDSSGTDVMPSWMPIQFPGKVPDQILTDGVDTAYAMDYNPGPPSGFRTGIFDDSGNLIYRSSEDFDVHTFPEDMHPYDKFFCVRYGSDGLNNLIRLYDVDLGVHFMEIHHDSSLSDFHADNYFRPAHLAD